MQSAAILCLILAVPNVRQAPISDFLLHPVKVAENSSENSMAEAGFVQSMIRGYWSNVPQLTDIGAAGLLPEESRFGVAEAGQMGFCTVLVACPSHEPRHNSR